MSDLEDTTTTTASAPSAVNYESVATHDDETTEMGMTRTSTLHWSPSLLNFVWMAVLFSSNHGCTVACLALATARLGTVGAWQSGTLYIFYTGSAVLGATYVVKQLGSRNSLIWGMSLYCAYVACFWIATVLPIIKVEAALIGAAIGGVGGGFLWTAQGAYFTRAAQEYSAEVQVESSVATSKLAGIFAFVYLVLEVGLRALSTFLLELGISWKSIFAIYTGVAVLSTIGMVQVFNYPQQAEASQQSSVFYKVTAAWQLLIGNAKMKYMIGLNAVFGFSGAFLNSYVNGEVERVALQDEQSKYVGILSSLVALVAAGCSLVFAKWTTKVGKGPILVLGAVCFFFVAFPFIVVPNLEHWGWVSLIFIYVLQGVGRATFEGTLKATFADYFKEETEGAFANIILQNGLSSAIGFVLSFSLTCSHQSQYCVPYKDGSLHDVLTFELLVCITAILAILGYWRASIIYRNEQQPANEEQLMETHR